MSELQMFIDSINNADTVCAAMKNGNMDGENDVFTIDTSTNDGAIENNGMLRLQFNSGNTVIWLENWNEFNILEDDDEDWNMFEFMFGNVKRVFCVHKNII